MLDVLLSNEISDTENGKYAGRLRHSNDAINVSVMCNLSKGIEEKGIAKGLTNGILFSIKSLIEPMDLTIEQAMAALKISEAERQKYVSASDKM